MDCHKKSISPSNVDQVDNVSLEFSNGLRLGDEDGACLHDTSHQCRCKDDKWVQCIFYWCDPENNLVKWLDSFDFNFYVSVLWFCLRAAAWGGGGFVLWKAQLRATHSLQGPFWLGDTANSQPQFYGSLTVMLLFFSLGYPIRVRVPDWKECAVQYTWTRVNLGVMFSLRTSN